MAREARSGKTLVNAPPPSLKTLAVRGTGLGEGKEMAVRGISVISHQGKSVADGGPRGWVEASRRHQPATVRWAWAFPGLGLQSCADRIWWIDSLVGA